MPTWRYQVTDSEVWNNIGSNTHIVTRSNMKWNFKQKLKSVISSGPCFSNCGREKKENSRDVSTRTDDVQTPSEIISRRQRYPSSGTHKPVCCSASTEAGSFPTSFFVASHPLCSAQPVDRRAYGGEGGGRKKKNNGSGSWNLARTHEIIAAWGEVWQPQLTSEGT